MEIELQLPLGAHDESLGTAAIGEHQLPGDGRKGDIVRVVQPQYAGLNRREDSADGTQNILELLGVFQLAVCLQPVFSDEGDGNLGCGADRFRIALAQRVEAMITRDDVDPRRDARIAAETR